MRKEKRRWSWRGKVKEGEEEERRKTTKVEVGRRR